MSRILSFLLGPELYWVLICILVRIMTRRHLAPDPAITRWLDDHWAWLPFIFAPLTFAFFLVPDGSRWWLLLRIDLAIAVGLVIAATLFCNGMTYHQPSSGPGAGTAFMVILSIGIFAAFVGTLIAAVTIWWRSPAHA